VDVDVRIDRWSDAPDSPAGDWAMQFGFVRLDASLDTNFYQTAQAGMYASSLNREWRLFLIDSTYTLVADLPLGVAATLGVWYGVGFDLDAATGGWQARITDIAAGTTLLNTTGSFDGWLPGSGGFDAIAFFDGEGTSLNTVSNLAVVDNIVVTSAVPEPAAWALMLAGVGTLLARRRRAA
jgi:hypothetical protein